MSDSSAAPSIANTVVIEDTHVPSDTQKQLQDYWRQFGPYHGALVPTTEWDGGGTTWDDGATIWVK